MYRVPNIKSSKAVHFYHLGEILSIHLPLGKYHFEREFSSLYGLSHAINLISLGLNTSISTYD